MHVWKVHHYRTAGFSLIYGSMRIITRFVLGYLVKTIDCCLQETCKTMFWQIRTLILSNRLVSIFWAICGEFLQNRSHLEAEDKIGVYFLPSFEVCGLVKHGLLVVTKSDTCQSIIRTVRTPFKFSWQKDNTHWYIYDLDISLFLTTQYCSAVLYNVYVVFLRILLNTGQL